MQQLVEFNELQAQIQVLVTPIKDIRVACDAASTQATQTRKQVKEYEKLIEAKRKQLVAPLNHQVDQINDFVKQIKAPLIAAEAHLQEQLRSWERYLEQERMEAARLERAEQVKRQKEAEAKILAERQEAATLAMFAPENAEALKAKADAEAVRIEFETKKAHWDASKEIKANKVEGATKRWTHLIVDQSLIPREFLIPDERKIRAYYMDKIKNDENHDVPGVKVFQELSIR